MADGHGIHASGPSKNCQTSAGAESAGVESEVLEEREVCGVLTF